MEEIPAGYSISESVNGIVSLAKKRPALILPAEIKAVEAAIAQHPKAHNYRVGVKHNRLDIYERVGPDAEDIITRFSKSGLINPGSVPDLASHFRADQERYGQFTPVMRFILADANKRTFSVQRMCYLGSIDDWIDIGNFGTIKELAPALIPTLGTDKFFELY